jgi:uncharacterized protein with ParB-like and HNH nuclease domain
MIDMSTITPKYKTVDELLQSQSFSIDDYQREYKWEKEHIDELLSDLLDKFLSCYQPGDEKKRVSKYEDYFLGSIIVSKRNGKNFLIDGQQRVTSLTLLLIYLYRAAKEEGFGVAERIAPLIFSDNYGEPSFNLDIAERLPVIESLFKGEPFTPDEKDESIQNMYNRYNDILEMDLVGELEEALPHFTYWLITKVGLIEISTDNDNYAYAIFETMNDRGKPLSPVDMLKAYLLAPIEDPSQRSTANQIWKEQILKLISWGGEHIKERDANCIKAWLRAQYANSIRDRKAGAVDKDWELIGTTFHRWVRDNRYRLEIGKAEQNISLIRNDFSFFAHAYRLILDASYNYKQGLEAVFYNAHNDFTWQNTVLMAPLCPTDDNETIHRKIAVTATYLDIWIMRRVVNYVRVTYSSTSYAMFVLCRDIRSKSLPELVNILEEKLEDDDVTFDGWPKKRREGIDDLHLNQFSRRYIYHLLARLTAFVEKESGGADMFDKYVDRNSKNPYDIEHIWSNDYTHYQDVFSDINEFQTWRNHVAGLLLLPADVNRSYQDKTYVDKAPHYAKNNLYAASLTANTYQHRPKFKQFREKYSLPFKPYDKFGKEEHMERRKLVKALVKLVWSPERIREAAK